MSMMPAKRVPLALLLPLLLVERAHGITNCEWLKAFDVTRGRRSAHRPGLSAVLRSKCEGQKIEARLESIRDAFDELFAVNRGTSYAAQAIMKAFMRGKSCLDAGRSGCPYAVLCCGADGCSGRSAERRHRWIFKWEGDMVLPNAKLAFARQVLGEAQSHANRFWWNIHGQAVYTGPQVKAWDWQGAVNHEVVCSANPPAFHHPNGGLWEASSAPFSIADALRSGLSYQALRTNRTTGPRPGPTSPPSVCKRSPRIGMPPRCGTRPVRSVTASRPWISTPRLQPR